VLRVRPSEGNHVDRLSPLDAAFLHIEDDVNLMHIGSVGIFEGPPPPFEDLAAMVSGKLPLVPRYRQRVRDVPFEFGRPVWVDDPHFSLDYHLRHTALPAPGGREELRNLVGRVMAQRIDLSKPLWEMWVIEGLVDDQWALISKVHHALVDGVSGTDLLGVILDPTPDSSPAVPDTWNPEPPPSNLRLVTETFGDYLGSPREQLRAVRARFRAPQRAVRSLAANVKGFAAMTPLVRPRAPSVLLGHIGPHRRYAWMEGSLADIKQIRSVFGGSVNDVILTVVTRGYRELLLAHDEDVTDRTVRSLVPVNVRSESEQGTFNNRVAALFADLPVGIADPVERLVAVRGEMDTLKHSGQAIATDTLVTTAAGFAPPAALAFGTRLAFKATHAASRQLVETVTTNVPGPQVPLYAAGRQMQTAFPYVPIAGPIRVGTAIFSYNGKITIGVTADRDSIDDLEVMVRGIEDGLAELVQRAAEV
jgi:diacylglycerol O-acyltransferase / wax synthase